LLCPLIVGSSVLLIYRRKAAPVWLTLYFIAATIMVTAKPMYVPYAAIFVPFGISTWRGLEHSASAMCWRGVLSCGLLALGIWYQSITPEWLRMKASYIAIFGTLLQDSQNPAVDAAAMNLKPEWIRYIGSTPYDTDSPVVVDPAFVQDFQPTRPDHDDTEISCDSSG
jgi:hypothetical protein